MAKWNLRQQAWSARRLPAMMLALGYLVTAQQADAAVDLSAGLSVGGEYDSNPIELSDNNARNFQANGFLTQQDDRLQRLSANAGAAIGDKNGPLYLNLRSQFTRVRYAELDTLDRSEYNLGSNLNWKPGRAFDLSLDYQQVRTPVSQNDVGGLQAVQQTSRQASGALRLRPTPTWQISLIPGWYENKLPLIGATDFKLSETNGIVQLDYLGVGRLVPGVYVKQAKGEYAGVANATRYRERSAGASLGYKVTDFSSFSLFAGYTRRTTHLIAPPTDPLATTLEGTRPSFTGRLSYQRQLSVKTAFNVTAFRDFRQYDVGVNNAVSNGFDGTVTWKPTAKLATSIGGTVIRWRINGLQIARTEGERVDLERSLSMSVKYQAMRFVAVRTYLTRRLHNSNVNSAVFDRSIAGLELSFAID